MSDFEMINRGEPTLDMNRRGFLKVLASFSIAPNMLPQTAQAKRPLGKEELEMNLLDCIEQCRKQLDEANVPMNSRFLVVSDKMAELMGLDPGDFNYHKDDQSVEYMGMKVYVDTYPDYTAFVMYGNNPYEYISTTADSKDDAVWEAMCPLKRVSTEKPLSKLRQWARIGWGKKPMIYNYT